ncbi:MAG: oxaloacetate decarboxylase [Chloroflexi bacterium]|nr:oxaloacetate decarboxylase [Chloroflexota bacterium]
MRDAVAADQRGPAARLRGLLARERLLVAPGVFDGLSARLAERSGSEAVYASGGAIARSAGYPDLGLLGVGEVLERLAQITEAVSIPVIADADTGYGNALNVRRAVRAFERVGVAALHLEDQESPKRCGHYEGKRLVPTGEMVGKLRAALEARRDPDLVIIARTDAVAVEGLEAALERASAYREAGADVLFVEAPESEAQIEAIAARLPGPKLINVFRGGKTPLLPAERLAELGYRVAILPSDLQRAAIRAMQETLEAIGRDGNASAVDDRLASFSERDEIVGLGAYRALDERYGDAAAGAAGPGE